MTAPHSHAWRGKRPKLPSPTAMIRARLETGADVRPWYDEVGALLASLAKSLGRSTADVCDVVAITSPRVSVARNLQLAHVYLTTGDTDGMMPSVRAALQHWEKTGEIRGPKTRAFSDALQGDTNAVVIDVWMIRALKLPEDERLTHKRHAAAAAKVRRIAARCHVSPRDAQALIWESARAAYGFTSARGIPSPGWAL